MAKGISSSVIPSIYLVIGDGHLPRPTSRKAQHHFNAVSSPFSTSISYTASTVGFVTTNPTSSSHLVGGSLVKAVASTEGFIAYRFILLCQDGG